MRRTHGLVGLWLISMVAVTAPLSVDAAVVQVTDRSALGGDDVIDWALGPMRTIIPNPSSVSSDGGLLADVSKPAPQGDFQIWYQTTGAWQGNFAVGDAVLHSHANSGSGLPGEPGPIVIDFSSPVAGAGAQIQRDTYGLFTGVVAAYDGGGGLLGEFSLDGEVLTDTGDNSAIFLGVLSDTADIARIEFSLDGELAFGINQVDIVRIPPAPALVALTKEPPQQQLLAGESAHFTITAKNTGDVVLSDIFVSDSLAPDCDRSLGSLLPGERAAYVCSQIVESTLTNTASLSAVPPVGPPATDDASAQVNVLSSPLAEVEVIWTSTTGGGTPGSSAIEAEPGDELTAELWLTPAVVDLVGYELSIEFDTDLADELDLLSATGIAPTGIPPIGGNPQSTRESSPTQRGNVLSFAAGPGQLPAETLVIGEIVFVATENVLSDGLDVFSGVFAETDGVFASPAGQDASDLVLFRGASVELLEADSDEDGVPDASDNCIDVPNSSQLDSDGDDYGNACDCDFDQNLACNISDFSVLREDYIATVDRGVGTDMDGNGAVNIADFSLFRAGYIVGVPGPSGLAP
jgi:uncharacterized repeat protein (TIGR01451 family)